MEKYTFLPHTADVKFQAFGKSLEEAYANAALAMFRTMSKDKIKESIKIKITVHGKDHQNLLYNLLEEFLFLLDTEDFFLARIRLKIKEGNNKLTLDAEATGDSVKHYDTITQVKAVTYHEMFVKKEEDKWIVQIIVDV